VKQNKHVENLREMLFSHKHFNLVDMFRFFDSDNSGTIDAEKIQEGFSKFGFVPKIDLERLVVEIVDDDDDGTVDLREFSEALTPRAAEFKQSGKGSMTYLTPEQRYVNNQAILETMAELFDAMTSADAEFEQLKESL